MAQRFVSPIYVDLGMPAGAGSPSGVTAVSVGSVTPGLLSLDELDPAALSLLPDPDALLKCDLDGVFDVTHHFHPSSSASALEASLKELEELEPLPLTATVATPVITRSAPSSSSSSERRGGRASQFTAKQRRERHNANERRRTNAAKDRVRGMRDEVSELEAQREELAASGSTAHLKPIAQVVDAKAVEGELGAHIPAAATYLDLVSAVDALRDEKRYLEEQLDVLDAQNSVLQALQCELTLSSDAVTTGKRKRAADGEDAAVKRSRSGEAADKSSLDGKEEEAEEEDDDDDDEMERIAHPRGGYCAETEAVPAYLRALFPSAMSSEAAFDWVKQSYGDIMAQHAARREAPSSSSRNSSSGDEAECASFLGWEAHKMEAEYLVSSSLAGVSSSELVFRSWRLLTSLKGLQTLFPAAKDLAVLQTVNDDCLVVRLGWKSAIDGKDAHSIVVLARGQIDGGYLVSVRSIPLTRGQQAFAKEEGGGRYVSLLGWLMLLDTPSGGCEVALGGRTEGEEAAVAGADALATAVRWQQAMGCGGGVQCVW